MNREIQIDPNVLNQDVDSDGFTSGYVIATFVHAIESMEIREGEDFVRVSFAGDALNGEVRIPRMDFVSFASSLPEPPLAPRAVGPGWCEKPENPEIPEPPGLKVERITGALDECHDAFRARKHGGVAEQKLRHNIEAILDKPYEQYPEPPASTEK